MADQEYHKIDLKSDYPPSVVAFIDICGYKNYVKDSENAQDMINSIIDIANTTHETISKAYS